MRVILLAAGRGTRMKGLDDTPKSLLPVAGESFLVRLIRQSFARNVTDVSVVVGHARETVMAAVAAAFPKGVNFIVNERYAEDVNINSLGLAMEADARPFHVIESDVWLSEKGFDALFDPRDAERSVWYSRGRFLPEHRKGGILKSDANGELTDLRIVDRYSDQWREYNKLLGVTKVGPKELERYRELLFTARAVSLKQYYLIPWIENLSSLTSYERDVGAENGSSVNTPDEYEELARRIDSGVD